MRHTVRNPATAPTNPASVFSDEFSEKVPVVVKEVTMNRMGAKLCIINSHCHFFIQIE